MFCNLIGGTQKSDPAQNPNSSFTRPFSSRSVTQSRERGWLAKLATLFNVSHFHYLVCCDPPVAPSNGGEVHSGKLEGDTVTYFCNKGYQLIGIESRTCQSNGEWSGIQPSCNGLFNAICTVMCELTNFLPLYDFDFQVYPFRRIRGRTNTE